MHFIFTGVMFNFQSLRAESHSGKLLNLLYSFCYMYQISEMKFLSVLSLSCYLTCHKFICREFITSESSENFQYLRDSIIIRIMN
jgi:hypothetical protein